MTLVPEVEDGARPESQVNPGGTLLGLILAFKTQCLQFGSRSSQSCVDVAAEKNNILYIYTYSTCYTCISGRLLMSKPQR